MAKKSKTRGVLAREKETHYSDSKLVFFPGASKKSITFQKTIPVDTRKKKTGIVVFTLAEFKKKFGAKVKVPKPGTMAVRDLEL